MFLNIVTLSRLRGKESLAAEICKYDHGLTGGQSHNLKRLDKRVHFIACFDYGPHHCDGKAILSQQRVAGFVKVYPLEEGFELVQLQHRPCTLRANGKINQGPRPSSQASGGL